MNFMNTLISPANDRPRNLTVLTKEDCQQLFDIRYEFEFGYFLIYIFTNGKKGNLSVQSTSTREL